MKLGDAIGKLKSRIGISAVLSCLSYSFCSVSMVMSNKCFVVDMDMDMYPTRTTVFPVDNISQLMAMNPHQDLARQLSRSLDIKFTFFTVMMQCIIATIIVEFGRRLGYANYDPFSMSTARRWIPVSICFSCMLFTSFKAFEFMNVPMVTVFKNLTNIVIVTGDWWIFHQPVSYMVIFSMMVMVFGALVASYEDFAFNRWGYFWMVANCCATAGYVLYMKYATQTIKLSRFGMVFYNNLLTTCMVGLLAWWNGEIKTAITTDELATPYYVALLVFSGVCGVLLNFASLWCVASTSATTYAVVGSVNVVPTAIIGYWLFKGNITIPKACFMALSMLGGFLYSYAKIQEKKRTEKLAEKIAVQDATEKEQRGLIMADVEEGLEDQTADHKA